MKIVDRIPQDVKDYIEKYPYTERPSKFFKEEYIVTFPVCPHCGFGLVALIRIDGTYSVLTRARGIDMKVPCQMPENILTVEDVKKLFEFCENPLF